MRFFDINIALTRFPGTYSASSESTHASFCFDGLDYTSWISNGQGTDGTNVWVERNFGSNRSFDRIFVQETNIENISLEVWNGSAYVTLPTIAIKSADLRSVLFTFAPQSVSRVRVVGTDTLTTNEEKILGSILIFDEIGALAIPPADINPKRVKKQSQHELSNAKYFVFNRGKRFEFDLVFKAHVGQSDIDLLSEIVERDIEFHVWFNDNSENIMNQKFAPFRFQDIYRVIVAAGDQPSYYKNLFHSGVDNKIKLLEVE